ncbi:UNVERIFIED_ORG: spermidine/putrescine-binding protein [Rhizobium sp. SORGH_AS 755]|nr:spermidine/putrescine-binding protein [Rhizobium sp. SORGH_AS_0755]
MKNRSLRLTLALTTALVTAGSAMAQEKVVHVYNWSDYIDESILADFTKETAHQGRL